jgi:hypothetical protein
MTRHYRGILALGAALLISGMIVSQWNSESRPAAALAPE